MSSPAWKPIKAAPKDGQTIVACNSQKGHRAPSLIFWDCEDGWCGLTAEDEKRLVVFPPTHWLVAVPALSPAPVMDAVKQGDAQ